MARPLVDSDSVLFLSIALIVSVVAWKSCDGGEPTVGETEKNCLSLCEKNNVECIQACLGKKSE